jgi:hypothetical protein
VPILLGEVSCQTLKETWVLLKFIFILNIWKEKEIITLVAPLVKRAPIGALVHNINPAFPLMVMSVYRKDSGILLVLLPPV